MKKTAIIITTIDRDDLCLKSFASLEFYLSPDLICILVDQTDNKTRIKIAHNETWEYVNVPYNAGLSVARNAGVARAKELGCEFCIIGSDSFMFNDTIKYIDDLIKDDLHGYDLIGFNLFGCLCDWEAKLDLIPGKSFQLEFINTQEKSNPQYYGHLFTGFYNLYPCDIVRNFFIARTEALYNSIWNPVLKLAEHEDFFWRFKQNHYKVAWTNLISAGKVTWNEHKYTMLRNQNFQEGKEKLKRLHGIKGWVTYANKPTGRKDERVV